MRAEHQCSSLSTSLLWMSCEHLPYVPNCHACFHHDGLTVHETEQTPFPKVAFGRYFVTET